MIAKILLPIAFEPLDYEIPLGMVIKPLDLVGVPFRRGKQVGLVLEILQTSDVPPHKLKSIDAVFEQKLDAETDRFIKWVARYTCAPSGLVLKMFLGSLKPEQIAKGQTAALSEQHFSYDPPVLNEEQTAVAQVLKQAVEAQAFYPTLLDGVTGSGKTEVYFEAMHACLEAGKTALVLLPEINLTGAWLTRFEKRFGTAPVQWHSHLTPKQRLETWLSIEKGLARVVVGTRSALCLPHKKLGLIVVDEEHDASFKQETQLRYHARDMAVRRAQIAACPIILSSATPSVETLLNVQEKKYSACHLSTRYGGAEMPDMHPIDLRQEKMEKDTYISPSLWTVLEENKQRGEQSLLFLNRRGFAPTVICKACGDAQACRSCDVGLVYHKKREQLLCHHCGYTRSLKTRCSTCDADPEYVFFGPGVEKIQQEVQCKHPTWRTALMTSDTLTTPKKIQDQMAAIESGEVDVIIATQSMAKGHHFPNLTLVGVIDATLGHVEFDLRMTERAYQVLHQVAGRSGRAQKKGHVYLQTFQPENGAFKALCAHARHDFFKLELSKREVLGLPPYGRLTALIVEGRDEKHVQDMARHLAKTFPKTHGIQVLGPAPAPLTRLKNTYRWRLLLKSEKKILHQPVLESWLPTVQVPLSLKVQIDIDPHSFS